MGAENEGAVERSQTGCFGARVVSTRGISGADGVGFIATNGRLHAAAWGKPRSGPSSV